MAPYDRPWYWPKNDRTNGRPEARRITRRAASTASVPVVRNSARSVLLGHTARSFSARSRRMAVFPADVQQVTPNRRIVELTASTTSG